MSNSNELTTTPSESFMKAPRAHYRLRGGKILAALVLLALMT